MCGIIGFAGSSFAVPKIIKGLKVLEYRGYDSVGIAVSGKDNISVVKCRGRVDALRERIKSVDF